MANTTARPRTPLLVALVTIILIGLASRLSGLPLPLLITKHLGDVLWATMFYVLVALAAPRWSVVAVALVSFAITAAIELFKLYHAPWIDSVRDVRAAGFLLGRVFAWGNFIAYLIGTLAGVAIDLALLPRPRR
ncbi:MAG: DUF2809 domain-containing protein [Phycisphaerae bacterium]